MTDNARTGNRDREYTNGEITVYWKPSECIHVTTCYRELIEVFNPRKRPWINMQGASTDEIIRIVELCPTDALTYKRNKDIGKASAEPEQEEEKEKEETVIEPGPGAEIRVMKDGPLVVKGSFTIKGSGGGELRQMKMATFCRCGQSLKMPFCDGTHRKINFRAD